ncbi:glutaredoxin domain-containing protein [Micromonospora sp. NPDC047548]|uniref:glutaredoxin family protein n=1 Tax=Micromonospora sp. NPDC047548 TaxID=3155624 RepID=UPI0033DA1F57
MTNDDLPHRDQAAPGLVVYGTGWCPDVRRSRALLDTAGIAYDYVDLEEDPTATELVRRLQRGHRRVPTLVWPDGSFLVEPTDDQLLAHLGTDGAKPGDVGD